MPTTPPQIHTLCPILGRVLDFLPEVFPPALLGNQHFGEFTIARNCPKDLGNKHLFSIFVSRGLTNFLFRMFIHPWFLEKVSSILTTWGSHESIGSDSVKLEESQHFPQFPGDAGSAGPRTTLRVQVSADNPGKRSLSQHLKAKISSRHLEAAKSHFYHWNNKSSGSVFVHTDRHLLQGIQT